MTTKTTLRAAGVALIVGSVGFIAVFTYLASAFGYPDVLDRSAGEVLPQLWQGGSRLRLVWFVYSVLPLVFVFAGVATASLLERGGRGLRALGVGAAVTAGVAMMLGLVRWPTIEWTLARHWEAAPAARPALAAMFDASNLFLGNLIGEFVGEIGVATWFVALGIAFLRSRRRVVGYLGVAAAVIVAVAALRNMTGAVALIAEINNITLPLWLIALGVVFFRSPPPTPTPVTGI